MRSKNARRRCQRHSRTTTIRMTTIFIIEPQPSLHGEYSNIALLLGLYLLQGIPLGLASAVPLFLASAGRASYSDLALFSISVWPYSLKLLWAPVVDALYTNAWGLGRRKSWIIPMQLMTGITMVVVGALGTRVDLDVGVLDVRFITAVFFCLYFLVATQDIAVDAWALELLRPENVGCA